MLFAVLRFPMKRRIDMNWPTIIVAALVAVVFIVIVVNEIHKKKSGKSSCSCGGSCGACGMNCHGKNSAE